MNLLKKTKSLQCLILSLSLLYSLGVLVSCKKASTNSPNIAGSGAATSSDNAEAVDDTQTLGPDTGDAQTRQSNRDNIAEANTITKISEPSPPSSSGSTSLSLTTQGGDSSKNEPNEGGDDKIEAISFEKKKDDQKTAIKANRQNIKSLGPTTDFYAFTIYDGHDIGPDSEKVISSLSLTPKIELYLPSGDYTLSVQGCTDNVDVEEIGNLNVSNDSFDDTLKSCHDFFFKRKTDSGSECRTEYFSFLTAISGCGKTVNKEISLDQEQYGLGDSELNAENYLKSFVVKNEFGFAGKAIVLKEIMQAGKDMLNSCEKQHDPDKDFDKIDTIMHDFSQKIIEKAGERELSLSERNLINAFFAIELASLVDYSEDQPTDEQELSLYKYKGSPTGIPSKSYTSAKQVGPRPPAPIVKVDTPGRNIKTKGDTIKGQSGVQYRKSSEGDFVYDKNGIKGTLDGKGNFERTILEGGTFEGINGKKIKDGYQVDDSGRPIKGEDGYFRDANDNRVDSRGRAYNSEGRVVNNIGEEIDLGMGFRRVVDPRLWSRKAFIGASAILLTGLFATANGFGWNALDKELKESCKSRDNKRQLENLDLLFAKYQSRLKRFESIKPNQADSLEEQ